MGEKNDISAFAVIMLVLGFVVFFLTTALYPMVIWKLAAYVLTAVRPNGNGTPIGFADDTTDSERLFNKHVLVSLILSVPLNILALYAFSYPVAAGVYCGSILTAITNWRSVLLITNGYNGGADRAMLGVLLLIAYFFALRHNRLAKARCPYMKDS